MNFFLKIKSQGWDPSVRTVGYRINIACDRAIQNTTKGKGEVGGYPFMQTGVRRDFLSKETFEQRIQETEH